MKCERCGSKHHKTKHCCVEMTDQQKGLAIVARTLFDDLELAEAAAQDKADGRALRFSIRDTHNREIVLGEMLVLVFVGCSRSIEQVMDGVRRIEGMEIKG